MGILSVSTGSLADGTQVMTLILDFSATSNIQVNLGGPIQARPVPIRTVYCDLSQTDQSLQIISQAAGDTPSLLCAGRSSGFYPCSFAPPGVLTVKFTGNAQYNPVILQLISTLIPGPVWPSAGGFAAAVWANAVRSLTVDPFTDAVGATLNWTHAARSITSIAPAFSSVRVRQSVPGGSVLDLRPAANIIRHLTGCHINNSANTDIWGIYDGGVFDSEAFTATILDVFSGFGTSAGCLSYRNGAVGASSVSICGFDIG